MQMSLSPLPQTVEREIRQRTWGRVSQLQVELADGRVIIRGCSSSYYAKQLAIQAAMEVIGEDDSVQLEVDIEVGAAPVDAHEGRDYPVGRF